MSTKPGKIIDTNVPIVASSEQPDQTTPACRLACIRFLARWFRREFRLLIDTYGGSGTLGEALTEYRKHFYPDPNPSGGIGGRFLMEVLTNIANPEVCVTVRITRTDDTFAEFPNDPRLAPFDPSDRKWVAIARAFAKEHQEIAPIANATDSDWRAFQGILGEHGVHIEELCDSEPKAHRPRSRRQARRTKSAKE